MRRSETGVSCFGIVCKRSGSRLPRIKGDLSMKLAIRSADLNLRRVLPTGELGAV
jgi:hypothetical protein